jgi:putative PIN family toxin of toxin-antitoxin system
MKIVLDSNIFISSFFWKGNPRKVFDRVTNGQDELYTTDAILQEIYTVMSRKKFDVKKNEIDDYIRIIERYSIKLFPRGRTEEIIRDKDDNKILECGIEGGVEFIITGDDDLLVLKGFENIRIVKPKEYLGILENIKGIITE